MLFFFIIPDVAVEQNGNIGTERLVQSTPGSPQDRRPNSFEVIGSAESLVGRVSLWTSNNYLCIYVVAYSIF